MMDDNDSVIDLSKGKLLGSFEGVVTEMDVDERGVSGGGDYVRATLRSVEDPSRSSSHLFSQSRLEVLGAAFEYARFRVDEYEVGADCVQHLTFLGPTDEEIAEMTPVEIPEHIVERLDRD